MVLTLFKIRLLMKRELTEDCKTYLDVVKICDYYKKVCKHRHIVSKRKNSGGK